MMRGWVCRPAMQSCSYLAEITPGNRKPIIFVQAFVILALVCDLDRRVQMELRFESLGELKKIRVLIELNFIVVSLCYIGRWVFF